ncbi:glycoside hydrolase [Spirosoma arcticum]
MKSLTLYISLLGFVFSLQAQPVKRIYLANDDHTDYMWTGNEAQYDTAFVRMLDYYMAQIDSTKNNPDDYQARWNCDGSYWLKTYQKFRSPAQFERLVGYIKSGHISSPLNSVVSTYGGQPTEAVLRGMYHAGQLERQYDLRFSMAVCMENQTMPFGLSSLWAGSGAKYSWRGVCACASKIDTKLKVRKHQLYRYMGFDNRSVLMKWYNIPGENTGLGGYGETRQEHKVTDAAASLTKTVGDLTALCDTIAPKSAYPYNVAGAFGYGWDDLETYNSPAFIAAARQTTTSTRRVRVSNEEDFFRDIEKTYKTIPAQSVSYGNEWDLYPVSMNETTAQVRRATEKLRSAEALATLVALKDSMFANDLIAPVNRAARNSAWDAYGLYWEHDWTADGPVSRQDRADWQIRQKNAITAYVDTLYDRARVALGKTIRATNLSGAAAARFYVFNPLSWIRSDVADFPFPGASPVRVIDLQTNAEVASQLIRKGGKQYLRIWAEDIPSVGYKVFEIRPGAATQKSWAAEVTGDFIQNAYYRLRLRKSGVISELIDLRSRNRQVIQPLDGRLFNDLGSTNKDAGSPVVIENEGPVSVTLRATSSDPIAHTVRVTLFRSNPRIEIEDSIQANFGDVKTWAFSLNLDKPTTHHEELGAILTAKTETRGGHYADQNARYDWLTFNHFADLSEPNYGVTLSNQDCSFFKLGQSTPDSLWEQSPQLSALAGGQVDGPKLGILNQNGATAFRYHFALTTHQGPFDALAAMRFSLEHQNSLVTGAVTGSADGYPATSYSFLIISNSGRSRTGVPADARSAGAVLLWSLKPSEEGINKGVITRFWNVKGAKVSPTVRGAIPIRKSWQTTHLETNERLLNPAHGQLKLNFAPHQLNTYRLQF